MRSHSLHYTRHDVAFHQRWQEEMRQNRWFGVGVWALFILVVGVIADLGVMASL